MARFDEKTVAAIFERSRGRCHLCGKKVVRVNYGARDRYGAWEVDHSIPVSRGATDHLNNLYPAHVRCNRRKQARSSSSVRRGYGRTRAPMSAAADLRARLKQAAGGAVAAAIVGVRFGGPAGLLFGLIGGIVGYAVVSEP